MSKTRKEPALTDVAPGDKRRMKLVSRAALLANRNLTETTENRVRPRLVAARRQRRLCTCGNQATRYTRLHFICDENPS